MSVARLALVASVVCYSAFVVGATDSPTGYVEPPPLLPLNTKFKLDSTIDDHIQTGTLRGIAYYFYHSDGSGLFAGEDGYDPERLRHGGPDGHWAVECGVDSMTDIATCHVHRGDMWIFVGPSGAPSVSIGIQNFPGIPAAIRIDKRNAFRASSRSWLSQEDSSAFVRQIHGSKRVVTRYSQWPYRESIERDYSTVGLAEAYEYVKWAAKTANSRPKPAGRAGRHHRHLPGAQSERQ